MNEEDKELIKKIFYLSSNKKTIYPYQLQLFFENSNKLIINKSRQIGISELYAFKLLLNAFTGKNNFVISPSERQSINFYNYAKKHYINLSSHLDNPPIVKDRVGYIEFSNGGSIMSLPNSPETIRGFSIQEGGFIVLDEFSHFENAEKIWQAVYPMISRGGKIVCISTPNGKNNLYYELWTNADKYGFKKILLNYRDCVDFTQKKIEELRKSMDEISWRQEYENEFIGGLNNYFSIDLINSCTEDFNYFEFPEQINEKLVFGIDIGRKLDKTAIVGINQKGQVKFIKTLSEKTFREQYEFICELVPNASIIKIDKNGIGMQLSEQLAEKYPHLIIGLDITNELKVNGFIELRKMFEQKQIKIPNNFELKRALNLIERKQSGLSITFDATRTDETGHSDLAFALMLAIYKKETGKIQIAQKGW